ncbi:hypothetical protein [Leifsonia poae]|nr:hypothetical protein [Leifsonia poae]
MKPWDPDPHPGNPRTASADATAGQAAATTVASRTENLEPL